MEARLLLLNTVLPGSALILRGRVLIGCCLLLPALACLGLLVLGALLTGGPLWDQVLISALSGIVLLALLADGLWWWSLRQRRVDPTAARRLCDSVVAAYLQGQAPEALSGARELCRLAPRLPGAWALLARSARLAGDEALGHRAERRARRLQEAE
ncbi:MAG: hypothetical protein ACOCXJ_01340 [Planctomycetota bacterium]